MKVIHNAAYILFVHRGNESRARPKIILKGNCFDFTSNKKKI